MQEVVKMMYILVETDDTSGISSPLKTTNRIKFLSFAASENYLIFGASSGGLYVYNRETFVFKTLVPGKEGPVACVKISPDEKWFGFATSRGISCVVEHNGTSLNRRILSHVHEGRLVTALQWNNCSNQLYVGDNTGQISVISVSSYLTPAVALMQLDSAIIQLDTCSYMLVASTMTRSYLCDTFREQYRQIGTRLRDGEYGACFYHVDSHEPHFELPEGSISPDQKDSHGPFSSLSDGEWLLTDKNLQNVKIFCARPGLRLWEVRIDGAVMSTHQFKQLRSTSPMSVIRPPAVQIFPESSGISHHSQLLQFTKLSNVSQKYLVTYDSNALCVLDPMTSEVILWTDQFSNISDVYVVRDTMYIWMGDSKLHAITITPIDKFLVRMYLQKNYFYCAQFCAAHVDTLKKLVCVSMKMHVLADLLKKIQEDEAENSLDETALTQVKDLLEEVSKNTRNQEQAQMLTSGIFIVGNAHLLSQGVENEKLKCLSHGTSNQKINDSMDFFPNLMRRPDFPSKVLGQNESDSMGGIFRKSILPTISSLPLHSDVNSDEDFDPFPDLPLSSLTSTETIMALKNLTTTVSGTISSSTKSLREKWQNLEEKFRGQEESGLSVEKSINRLEIESSTMSDMNDDYEETITKVVCKKKPSTLPLSVFIEKCHQITSHETDNCKNIQELEMEMFDSFAILYAKFMLLSMAKSEKNINILSEMPETVLEFKKWLSSSNFIPFPFHEHFDEDFVVTLKSLFQNFVRSGTLKKWVSQFLSHIELDYRLFPHHIGRIHCKDSLLLDQAIGRTLSICCGLLDPHTALQNLDVSGSTCQYFSWNVIMDHFQNSPATASLSSRVEEDSKGWPLPRILNAMLVLLQLGQVDSSRSIGEGVPIKHVLRTVLKLEEEQAKIFKLFLSYLEKIPSIDMFAALKDPEIYYYTRYAFESLHKTDPKCNCACGFPLTEVQYSKMFRNVGQILLSHVYETEDVGEAMSLCLKTGVLWHHFLVLRREEPIGEMLPLIIHVGLVEELRHRSHELTLSILEILLQLRIRLEQGHCLHCNANLEERHKYNLMPWTSLASLLLQETSIDNALALLSKYSHLIPAGSLNLQFYQTCLMTSIAENLNVDLKKGFLQVLAASDEMPVLSPKLASSLGFPQSQEPHHWGLKMRQSECHCLRCLLPLFSASGGSVVSFQCLHSFHSVCLQQQLLKLCPICVKL